MDDDQELVPVTTGKRKKTKVEVKCRTVLDKDLVEKSYFKELCVRFKEQNINYEFRKLAASDCLLWEHYNVQPTLTENQNDWAVNKQVIRLIASEELKRMSSECVLEMCKQTINAFPDACLTLFVLTVNPLQRPEYFNTLIEAQVLLCVRWRLLSYDDCAAEIARFQKALTEAPSKAHQTETENLFKNFVSHHNRKCVRVVERHGLYRLWQQHLLTVPGITLNITDQIMSKYTCPAQFIAATKDPSINAAQLFQDIQVNPSNKAKVGKSTSNKLHKFYTSTDGNATLDS